MKILYVGDIMGEPGMQVVEKVLPDIISSEGCELIIAQAENVTDGRGIVPEDYRRLQRAGIDFFTGGNWTLHRKEIYPMLASPEEPIIRPANYPADTPGLGHKVINKNGNSTLVISLLGSIVGKDADKTKEVPLKTVDSILDMYKDKKIDAIVVNFHGDYSSEKVIIGHYLDGKVSASVGDHWHVPTADARILPKGTAHISDVGMCGILNASLGVSLSSVLPRWHDGVQTRNQLETAGPLQFNAVLIDTNDRNSSTSIKQIQKII
ncbi:MAG TPA: TIGR00282 family metallophosphoesterase [Candidatus Saccharimonadales bacterium]|nr:TIGR00282 family metallophosphoesterase [Candidatus Saccharimonadales bacterium]